MKNSDKIIHRKEGKIVLVLFLVVLLAVGSMNLVEHIFMDNAPLFSMTVTTRNKKIDSMVAKINRTDDSEYQKNDINECIKIIKDNFKNMDRDVCLTKICFDESECNYLRDISSYIKENDSNNLLVVKCNFYVYHSFEAFERGVYRNWQMIFKRDTEDSPWTLIDQGYA